VSIAGRRKHVRCSLVDCRHELISIGFALAP
jgi:hypothetical protein